MSDAKNMVYLALQNNEEARPIIEAIEQDNPHAEISHFPAMVKIDAAGRLVVREFPSGERHDDRSYRMALLAPEIPGMREWWVRYYRGLLRYDTDSVRADLAPIRPAH